MSEKAPVRSALHEYFRSAGARFRERHGWLLPTECTGLTREYEALREGCGAVDLSWEAQLLVHGAEAEDAVAALDRELSQLPIGGARRILVGDGPEREAALFVRTGPAAFLALAESFRAAQLRRALLSGDRDVRIEDRRGRAAALLLLGPRVPRLVQEEFREHLPRPLAPGNAALFPFHGFRSLLVPTEMEETPAAVFIGAAPVVQHLLDELRERGVTLVGTDAYECWRLEHGLPLAAEDVAKAREPWPPGTPCRLVSLILEGPPSAEAVSEEEARCVQLAAWKRSPRLDGVVALAVIEDRADVRPGAAVRVGGVRGNIVEPPLTQWRSNGDVDPEHP